MVIRELGEESGTPTAAAETAVVDKPTSSVETEGNTGSGSAETPVEKVSETNTDDGIERVSEEASSGKETPEGNTPDKDFYVGTYKTKEEADEGFRLKEEALASERSRADTSLDKYNKLMNQVESKYAVDANGNIMGEKPPQSPTKSKEELMEAATLGDKVAMDELLRMSQTETLAAVQAMTATDRKRYEAMEKYPDLKDPKSALYRETDRVVKSNRVLHSVDGIEIAVQLAQKNLLDKELPRIKQKAVDGAHRSIVKKGTNSVENPGTTVAGRETESLTSLLGENHEEKLSWVTKMGADPKKVIEKAKKRKGGRFL